MSLAPSVLALVNQLLHGSGRLAARQSVTLHPLAGNPERRDHATLRRFRAAHGAETLALVTVGPDLAGLRKRSELFAEAYPTLACPVFAHGSIEGQDLLLAEYFAGTEATKALAGAGPGPGPLLDALRAIAQRFEQAIEPSTQANAKEEIGELCEAVLRLPYWAAADRAFLTGVVFPYAEEHLVASEPRRRVTNGDFILQNILLGAGGAARLVDYEQAASSHYFAEDWLRLTYWDQLPEEIRQFARTRTGDSDATHFYLALKQLRSEAEVNLPQKAQADARHWCDKIRENLIERTNALRHAMLWPGAPRSTEAAAARLQLFWMTDEGWSTERSLYAEAEEGKTTRLTFRIPAGPACHALRLDPGEAPGALVIHELTVLQGGEQRHVVWKGSSGAELRRLEPAGDAVIEPDSDPFKVVSVGSDPQLFLHAVGAAAGTSLEVEAVVTYLRAPGDQIAALRSGVVRLRAEAAVAAEITRTLAALRTEMDRLRQEAEVSQAASAREKEAFAESLSDLRGQTEQAVAKRWRAIAECTEGTAAHLTQLLSEVRKLAASQSHLQEAVDAAARARAAEREALKAGEERDRRREADREKVEAEHRRLLALQAATRASLEATEKQLVLAREYLSGHAATVDRLEQALARRDAELAASQQERQATALDAQHARDELGRLAQELAAAREQGAVLRQLQDRIAGEKDALVVALEAERQTRQRQENTFIWRTTTPLRRLSSWFLNRFT